MYHIHTYKYIYIHTYIYIYIYIHTYIYIYINQEGISNYYFMLVLRVSCLTQSFNQLKKIYKC